MKYSRAKDWMIDSVILVGLFLIAARLQQPLDFWFEGFAYHRSLVLYYCVGILAPHVITGCFLGLTTATLIRHRKLVFALLPSFLFCFLHILGTFFLAWSGFIFELSIIFGWLLSLGVALCCARFALSQRQHTTMSILIGSMLATVGLLVVVFFGDIGYGL